VFKREEKRPEVKFVAVTAKNAADHQVGAGLRKCECKDE